MKHHTSDMHHDKVGRGVEGHNEVHKSIHTKTHSEKHDKINQDKAAKKYRLYTKDHKHRLNRPLL